MELILLIIILWGMLTNEKFLNAVVDISTNEMVITGAIIVIVAISLLQTIGKAYTKKQDLPPTTEMPPDKVGNSPDLSQGGQVSDEFFQKTFVPTINQPGVPYSKEKHDDEND